MKIKKELIVAVLATFCLTAALFMIVPTRSQTSSYNARTDVNGDGTIDMADISVGIEGFMTNGDPTLDVNVMNWPLSQAVSINWTGHATQLIKAAEYAEVTAGSYWMSDTLLVDGYSRFSVNIRYAGYAPNEYKLYSVDNYTCGLACLIDNVFDINDEGFVRTYDVANRYIRILIQNTGTYTAYLYVDVYLVA